MLCPTRATFSQPLPRVANVTAPVVGEGGKAGQRVARELEEAEIDALAEDSRLAARGTGVSDCGAVASGSGEEKSRAISTEA